MSEPSLHDRALALLRNGRWGQWISRGTWTLIDRGLFALSNFVLNVTLARWMSLEAYGSFAVAFSIFLMMGAGQTSIIVGPMLVFGPKRYQDCYQAYLGLLIKGQMALSLLVSIGLGLAGAGCFLWGSRDISVVLLALALAGPFILLLWLLRQSGYVHLQAKRAAAAGAIYMVLLLSGTYLLYRLAILSPATALFLMALASLFVAIWLVLQQRPQFAGVRLRSAFAREVAVEHWRYARWMLPARLLVAGRNNLFFFVLPIWGGLEATAALRAIINLTMPLGFMQNALSVIVVPILSRARNNGTFHEKAILGLIFFVVSALVYGIVLVVFQDELIQILYAGRYGDYSELVWLIAVLIIMHAVSSIFSSILSAMEEPRYVFSATLAGVIGAATVGVIAVAIAGELGAVIGLVFSELLIVIALGWRVRIVERYKNTRLIT